MGVKIVKTSDVKYSQPTPYRRDVERAKIRLKAEGMIEPILVNSLDALEITDKNHYDPTILEAARQMNWETVIVAVMSNSG